MCNAAPYMIKAAKALQVFYPNLIHVTCFDHGVHQLAEEVRSTFGDVNELISSTKKVFLKAPARTKTYKEKIPNVPLPPEPDVTRWGTWIEAVLFYNEHFEAIQGVVIDFDSAESRAIFLYEDEILDELDRSEGDFSASDLYKPPEVRPNSDSDRCNSSDSEKDLELSTIPSSPALSSSSLIRGSRVRQSSRSGGRRFMRARGREKMVTATNQTEMLKNQKTLGLTLRELKTFFGISMVMATIGYPKIKMYWEKAWRLPIVADNMTRDRFFLLRTRLKVVFDNDIPDSQRAIGCQSVH
ncbi:hypothetical protein HW555_000467 [Spodoptera exigua]|uniref:PiggyBac transposable element-derived protein domain-containing protein n=1 Tax=Spodoptera exigua TaxID=7107 RepID=A0A835L8T5_SPOEX|nr:hypothetical protein HW555_000467 [Spodoptera exigua]